MDKGHKHHTPGDILGEINFLVNSIDVDAPKPNTFITPHKEEYTEEELAEAKRNQISVDEYLDRMLDDVSKEIGCPKSFLLGTEPAP